MNGRREGPMRSKAASRALPALSLALLALGPPGAPLDAQDPPVARQGARFARQQAAPQEGITVNFQDLDLGYVLTALGRAAGINVIASNMPAILVSINNPDPFSVEQVRSLILALAAAHGVEVTEQEGSLLLQGPVMQDGELLVPRQLFIHRLQHSNAVFLASTLQALFGGSMPIGLAARQPSQTLSQELRTLEQQSAQSVQGIQTGAQQQAVSFVTAPGELENAVQIVPDEISNSLLVRATVNDWAIIQQAIESLDLRPLQVVIEVVIAEVRRTGDLNVGVGFLATDVDIEAGEGTTGILPVEVPGGAFTLDILRTGDVDVGVTLSALASTGDVRILSRPLVQAQNNQEARILVGSERPFIQSSYSSVNTGGVAQEVVQYRDVGTALTILPTINEDGYVNLLLTQEVSSATAELQFGAPVISTREATTQILAQTGQTVVVGGLVEQQTEESRTGIPILMDIPVLGWLFGTTKETVVNSELFLFLTPFVVANDEDEERLREEFMGNVELLQELMPIKSMLPPSIRALLPDSISMDTILPDTVQVDTMRVDTIRPDTLRPDTIRPDIIPWRRDPDE